MEPPLQVLISFLLILNESGLDDIVDPALDWSVLLTYIIVILVGLALSAFFSSSEVAFFSAENRNRFDEKDKTSNSDELRVKKMLEKPRRLLNTILIGNTFANIIAAVFAAVLTGELISYFGATEWIVYTFEIIVLTFTIVVLTEITPKILALKNPIAVSRNLSGLLYLFFVLLGPIAILLSKSTQRIEKRIPHVQDNISSEDLKTIAEVGELQGTLKGEEREIIENVIEFGNTTVKEIMTSRVNMVAISTDESLDEVLKLIREKSISRFPLYENDLDTIMGIIHAKDILPFIHTKNNSKNVNWKTIARKAFFIPAVKKIDDLLKDFQREKTHVAIVVDEYGGTEGLVTLDDVLEEIIGEMGDEQSGVERLYTRRKNGEYIFDAKIDLDEVGEILNKELTTSDDEYETLGGLIYNITERIPEQDEVLIFKDIELTVLHVENNRVKKIKVRVLPNDDSKTEIDN